MSDHSGQPYHQGDQRAGQSMHFYQSVWMAHWTQTSCSATPQVQNGLSLSLLLMSNDDVNAKKFTEIIDTRTVRIMNEEVAMTERLDCQPFPMFNIVQIIVCAVDSNNGLDNPPHGQESRPQLDYKIENNNNTTIRQLNLVIGVAAHGSGSREHVFKSEMVSQFIEEPVTQMMRCGANKGKAPELSSVGGHEKVKLLTLGSASKKCFPNTSTTDKKPGCNHDSGKFSILNCDINWDDHATSGKIGTSFMRPSNASLLQCDPSAGNNKSPIYAQKPSKNMENFPHAELFPNRITLGKESKSENLSQGGYTSRRISGSMHTMEAMEISTANSVNEFVGGPTKFSQNARNLL